MDNESLAAAEAGEPVEGHLVFERADPVLERAHRCGVGVEGGGDDQDVFAVLGSEFFQDRRQRTVIGAGCDTQAMESAVLGEWIVFLKSEPGFDLLRCCAIRYHDYRRTAKWAGALRQRALGGERLYQYLSGNAAGGIVVRRGVQHSHWSAAVGCGTQRPQA